MARRPRLILLIAITGVGLALLLLIKQFALRSADLSANNVTRIEVGMSLEEVEAILGTPPFKSYTRSDLCMVGIPPSWMGQYPPNAQWIEWMNNDGHLYVVLDTEGQVFCTYHTPFPKRSLMRQLKDTFSSTAHRGGPLFIR